MYCINVKEQFDERFMIKAPIYILSTGIQYFQARSVIEATYILLPVLAMLSFAVTKFYSEIEIDLYSLYRKKVIAAFKLNGKSIGPGIHFREKKHNLSLASQAV